MPTTDSAFVPKYGEGSFAQTYTSFSGVDIQAVFGDTKIGNLQGVSYSITREKAPIYCMGSVDPLGFSRGKRGIAGSSKDPRGGNVTVNNLA